MKHSYAKTSLRELIPDHWGDTLYCHHDHGILETKDLLAYHSNLLGYAIGAIDKTVPTKELAKFVKENSRAAMRLKAIAVYAYESFANCSGFRDWHSVGSAAYLCLSAASSSLDAWACVLQAVVLGKTPVGTKIPGFPDVVAEFAKSEPSHPLTKHLVNLSKSSWLKKMREARKRVVHRGEWPMWKDVSGLALFEERGIFDVHLKARKKRVPKTKMTSFNLPRYMAAFVKGMEQWERRTAKIIAKHAKYPSLASLGIVVKVPVIGWHNGLSDHFLFGEGFRTDFAMAEEFIAWRNRLWNDPQNKIKEMHVGSHAM